MYRSLQTFIARLRLLDDAVHCGVHCDEGTRGSLVLDCETPDGLRVRVELPQRNEIAVRTDRSLVWLPHLRPQVQTVQHPIAVFVSDASAHARRILDAGDRRAEAVLFLRRLSKAASREPDSFRRSNRVGLRKACKAIADFVGRPVQAWSGTGLDAPRIEIPGLVRQPHLLGMLAAWYGHEGRKVRIAAHPAGRYLQVEPRTIRIEPNEAARTGHERLAAAQAIWNCCRTLDIDLKIPDVCVEEAVREIHELAD